MFANFQQKVRNCLETAVRYVKKKRKSARQVTLLHHPELSLLDDDAEEEEIVPEPEVKQSGPLIVRSISGKVVHSQQMTGDGLRVKEIVNSVCQNTEARPDEVRLLAGATVLEHNMTLGYGECVAHPGPGQTLEIALAVVAGPAVTAHATSGSRIEVMDGVPEKGDGCHFDRDYVFTSLGDFAGKQGMHYVMTSNNDRKTPAHLVMWQLDIREVTTVFVNFRSDNHIENGKALKWLRRDNWELQPDFHSTVSTGYPNGPYAGPVYAKTVRPQNRKYLVDLMGSDYWEGTYFVFVQIESEVSSDT